MWTAKTLSRLGDALADLSLHWAHSHFVGLVMSRLKFSNLHAVLTVHLARKYFSRIKFMAVNLEYQLTFNVFLLSFSGETDRHQCKF